MFAGARNTIYILKDFISVTYTQYLYNLCVFALQKYICLIRWLDGLITDAFNDSICIIYNCPAMTIYIIYIENFQSATPEQTSYLLLTVVFAVTATKSTVHCLKKNSTQRS